MGIAMVCPTCAKALAEELAPVLDRAVRGQHGGRALVAAHDDLEEVLLERRPHTEIQAQQAAQVATTPASTSTPAPTPTPRNHAACRGEGEVLRRRRANHPARGLQGQSEDPKARRRDLRLDQIVRRPSTNAVSRSRTHAANGALRWRCIQPASHRESDGSDGVARQRPRAHRPPDESWRAR